MSGTAPLPPYTSFLEWWTMVNAWLEARGEPVMHWQEAYTWWHWCTPRQIDELLLDKIVGARRMGASV